MPPVPTPLQALPGNDDVQDYHAGDTLPDADLCLVLDTGAWSQLAPIRPALEPRLDHTLIIDHHLTGDIGAAFKYIDGKAAAACEIVARFIDGLSPDTNNPDALYTDTVQNALFAGIASDTGWFRFSNTRPETHRLAARLQALGVDHADLYRRLEQAERPQKIGLVRRALDSLEFIADGQAAVMVLRATDFSDTGAQLEETERIIDLPQIVDAVEVVVLITESRNSRAEPVRISFRSKPPRAPLPPLPPLPPPTSPTTTPPLTPHPTHLDQSAKPAVNVADLAGHFGGGGHARAAGAKIMAPLDDVITQVKEAIVAAIA